jgi:hypothetical protein
MTTVTIELTPAEAQRLLELAHAQGYDALDAFVHDLVTTEAVSDEDDDDPVEGFRIAWGQAMRGETMTWEEFLAEMNDDD